MSISLYSHIFPIRILLSVTCLFSVSKCSYRSPQLQDTSNGNSSTLLLGNNSTLLQGNSSTLFHGNISTLLQGNTLTLFQVRNATSQESRLLKVHDASYRRSSTTKETYTGLFSWNNLTMTAGNFQSFYCSRQCHGDVMVTPRREDYCLDVICFPCDCVKPLCEFYGTCCPGYFLPSVDSNIGFDSMPTTTYQHFINSNGDEKTVHLTEDASVGVTCENHRRGNYLTKRSCPANYPDGEVKSKCYNDVAEAEQDVDTFLRVTDNSGRTYYNEHCAVCNDVFQFAQWTLLLECSSYMTVYSSRTSGELLRRLLASNSCKTLQEPASSHEKYTCDSFWFRNAVVDTCNVTGEWNVYDANVVKACADASSLVNRVKDRNGNVYRNFFCAVCNMHNYPDLNIHCPDVAKGHPEPDIFLPFSVFLNFGSSGRLTVLRYDVAKCSKDSDWTSPDNKCFPLECSPGKILTNGSCSTAFSQIRGLLYQMHIYYVPSVLTQMTMKAEHMPDFQHKYLKLFENQIMRFILIASSIFQIELTVAFYEKTYHTEENQTDEHVNPWREFHMGWFKADGFIQSLNTFSRDDVETFLVSELILNNITIDIDTNTTMTLMPLLYPDEKHSQEISMLVYPGKPSCICASKSFSQGFNYEPHYKNDSLILEPHLNCAFVKFNKTEYLYHRNITTKPHIFSITLHFKGATMDFTDRAEVNMASIDGQGELRMCFQLLTDKTFIKVQISNNNVLKMPIYILTLMCLIASIMCLTITLVTYFLFPLLRSVAGKNNMFLSGSLLLSQLSLLATSHVQETGHLCTFLAICTHFFWLCMFCWCFTCCFHMFCVFSAKSRRMQTTAYSEIAYMIKRIVACSVFPCLTITGVITTNYAISEGQLIGYGNATCFLDSQIYLIITLVAPMCLILLFNFIFLSITVVKIYNVRKLQTREFRKDDRNNLCVYIKLSSLTGCFWILSVISEATDNDPLRFIAVGLNGLQGVFIFMSYICNRRVLRLYQNLLGLEEYATTSTSHRSTIANAPSDVDKQSH